MTHRPGRYVLVDHRPVAEPDLLAWGRWLENADRHVADDSIGDARVSTVFLGLDHNLGGDRVELFETMIFGGDRDGECHRYATWDDALTGHRLVVATLETR